MAIGGTIRRLRIQENRKANEFAEKVGTSKSYLSQLEGGSKNPSKEILQKIADELDYPIYAFEDEDYEDAVGMHNLFRLFNKYAGSLETDATIKEKVENGSLDEGVYIKLSEESVSDFMRLWYEKYAEEKAGTLSKEDFQKWMDRFTVQSEPNQSEDK